MPLSRDNNWSESLNLISKRETSSRKKSTLSTLKQRKLKAQSQKFSKNWKNSKLKLTNLKSIKMSKLKLWMNLIKISRELVIRKSNIGMKRISLESKRMNSTINTTILLSISANSNISFKTSNGWLKWKVNFKKLKTIDKRVRKIMKKELRIEKREKMIKKEEMKNMLQRKEKRLREKLKQKKMPSKMLDKTKLILWIHLMLLSMIKMLVQIFLPLKLNNVMLF